MFVNKSVTSASGIAELDAAEISLTDSGGTRGDDQRDDGRCVVAAIRAEWLRSRAVRRTKLAIASVALMWAVGNALYVYLALAGASTFRVESAAFILAGVLLPLVSSHPAESARRTVLIASDSHLFVLLAVALWMAVLVPFVTLPFLSDDYVFLVSYVRWSDALRVAGFVRPMFAVVFMLLARLGNGSAVPFHIVSLIIHGVSAWCTYILSHRLFQRRDAAVISFAVFLLNPLQPEPVLWVSGLQELLWTVFVLAGLVVYTKTRLLSVLRLTSTLALIVCALLSKETAISSILLIPAADWALFRMKRGRLLPVAYVGLGVIVAAYAIGRALITSIDSGFFVIPGRYFIQKFVGVPYGVFVQPWNTAAVHVPAIVRAAASVTAFIVVFLAVVRKTGSFILAGPAIMLISTLPVYSYFYIGSDLQATRYLYFASVGWAVLVAQVLVNTLARRLAMAAALVGLIVVLFASLQVNLGPWRRVGEIVRDVTIAIQEGQSGEMSPAEWKAKYGDGLELRNGIPIVYKGVYVFLNGYPELRRVLTAPEDRLRRIQ